MANRIQLRRGTAAHWASTNPVLGDGEPGIEKDTGKQKFGNGIDVWTALPYASEGPQGIPGVADDASVEALITDAGSDTRGALNATFALTLGKATANDTARINALLTAARVAGGGVLTGLPGENYKISAPLLMGSNTELDLSKSTLTELPGSECNMVTNYSDVNPVATATDAATTSGSNVITTSLGAQAVPGQTVYVAGAGSNGYGELVGNVVSATATTITICKLYGNIDGYASPNPANASAAVTGAAIQLSNRDKHVKVRIGKADRGTNGPTGVGSDPRGQDVNAHSIFFRGVDHYLIDIGYASSTDGISFIWPTNVYDGDIWLRDCDVVRTGVQVVGPAHKTRLHEASGKTNDDLVNFCGNVYPNQTNTSGDINDVVIGRIHGRNNGGSFLKLNCGQGNVIDGVVVEGSISGSSNVNLNTAVYIGSDPLYPATDGGTYRNIDLGFMDARPRRQMIAMQDVQGTSIKARGTVTTREPFAIRGSTTNSLQRLELDFSFVGDINVGIWKTGNTDVRELILRIPNFDPKAAGSLIEWDTGTAGSIVLDAPAIKPSIALTWYGVLAKGGTIESVTVRGGQIDFFDTTAPSALIYADSTSTVKHMKITGTHINKGDSLVRTIAGSVVQTIHFRDVTTQDNGRLGKIRSNCDVYVDGVRRNNASAAALYFSGATCTVHGGSYNAVTSNTTLIQRAAAETITVKGFGLPVDLVNVPKVNGSFAYNTNASLVSSTFGVGPSVCDGANWKNLFTGLTY